MCTCVYTEVNVCVTTWQAPHPPSTATSQSPGCLQSWGDASALSVQAGSDLSFLLPVWKDQNPRARSELPRRGDAPAPSSPRLNLGLAFLQEPVPPPQQGSFELGLVTSYEAKVGMCGRAAVRLSMGYGICRWRS